MSRSAKKRRKHQAAAGQVSQLPDQARPGGSFGVMLLHARTQRGISVDEVAKDTRVAKRYVIALESESLSSLPGGLYNRAYVRTYATYLGLDADAIVRDYDRAVQEQSGIRGSGAQPDQMDALRAAIEKKESRTAGRNAALETYKGPLVAGIAVVVLAGGVWVGARHLSNPAEPTSTPISITDPVVSDTAAKSGQINESAAAAPVPAAPELRAPGPEQDPVKPAEIKRSEARQAPTSISVNDSGVGTDIVNRQLAGRSDTFAVGTRIIFWTLVTGGRAGDTIRHAWLHRGRSVATVKLPVSGANWRTHSQRVLGPGTDGEWAVEARDEQGRVLARHAFTATDRTSEARSPQP